MDAQPAIPEDFSPQDGVRFTTRAVPDELLETHAPPERQLTDKQIDEVTDPHILVNRIPGFKDYLENIKRVRIANARDVTKFSKKPYDGWAFVGSLHPAVSAAIQQFYTPEELAADGGKLIKQYLMRHKAYKVTDESL